MHYLQRTRCPDHTLASSGASIGIREGRRIVGDYVLTQQDVPAEDGRDFPDGVAVGTARIDFHGLTRPGHVGWRRKAQPCAIPLRCLIARGFGNLMMAGKCISGDQVAMSSYRMTPTCAMIGQAAGTAAAMAIASGLDEIRALDVAELRRRLRANGMQLGPRRHRPFAPELSGDASSAR